jgi:hypothetical protein
MTLTYGAHKVTMTTTTEVYLQILSDEVIGVPLYLSPRRCLPLLFFVGGGRWYEIGDGKIGKWGRMKKGGNGN